MRSICLVATIRLSNQRFPRPGNPRNSNKPNDAPTEIGALCPYEKSMTLQLNTLAGKRVLIAEDEPMIAMDHAALLVRVGAEIVATCAAVRGAVDCVGEMAIDVAVIDFMLADGNSQPLQAALNRKHIPFVVVTAYPRPLVRAEPNKEGSAETGDIRFAVWPRRSGVQARELEYARSGFARSWPGQRSLRRGRFGVPGQCRHRRRRDGRSA